MLLLNTWVYFTYDSGMVSTFFWPLYCQEHTFGDMFELWKGCPNSNTDFFALLETSLE